MRVDEFVMAEVCESGGAHFPAIGGVSVVLRYSAFVFEEDLHSIPAFIFVVSFSVFGLEVVEFILEGFLGMRLEGSKTQEHYDKELFCHLVF